MEKIFRSFDFKDNPKINDTDGIIEGYASVYNQKTSIGNYFYEIIERGAFDETDLSDVLFFTNHNGEIITLARSRQNNPNSTLKLNVDSNGLAFKAAIDIENNSEAKSLFSSVKRGDIDGMSFSMVISDDEWQDLDTDMPTRIIKKISKVYEISAVNQPAYEGTSIYTRSADLGESDKEALKVARSKFQKEKELALLKEKIKLIGGGI